MTAQVFSVCINILFKTVVILICILLIIDANASDVKHRVRRKVVFSKSSKFFFRLNGKDNVLNFTDLLVHGWTIRVNYDLPETIPKRHTFFKRSIHSNLFDTEASLIPQEASCVLKYICETALAVQASENCEILCEVGKIIRRSQNAEADFFKKFLENCDYYYSSCPHTFRNSFVYNNYNYG